MVSSHKKEENVQLESGNELRLIVDRPDDVATIRLTSGTAEIFGSELEINKYYEFSYFSSISVFTWDGCTLKLRRNTSKIFFDIRLSTQLPQMRDLYLQLEEIRTKAEINNTDNPITLIIGPTDVGKSTLSRVLLNYAAKNGKKPIFIDLDVGQSSLSITGTFGVLSIHEPSDVNSRFDEQQLSVYYFGYKSPGFNIELYKLLVQKVGRALKARLKKHEMRKPPVLIDTCGWIDGAGYNLIKEIIQMLEVNVILVLSEFSLYSKLRNYVSSRTEVLFVDKFNVTTRNRNVRMNHRDASVQKYFYGASGQLEPHVFSVHFSELQIFKADISLKNNFCMSNVVPVAIEPSILNHVFGLSYAEKVENIPLTSVYGFISIVELDMITEVATILSPQPGPLPTPYLLMGDIILTPKEMVS